MYFYLLFFIRFVLNVRLRHPLICQNLFGFEDGLFPVKVLDLMISVTLQESGIKLEEQALINI
jgi:hypothetical protein